MKSADNLSQVFELFQFERILIVILGLVFVVIVGKFLRRLSEKMSETAPNYRLQFLQFTTILSFILYIFGTLGLVFGVLQPSKELLLGLGGSAAVALGFSLKDLVASIVAGVTLLFDRPFQVGDRVTFSGTYGEITNIGLRAVRLQTLDDNEVTIPNSKFMSEYVASGNSGSLDMMVVCDFHVSLDSEISKAKTLLYQVVATSRFVFLKKPIKIITEETYNNYQLAMRLKVKAYVFDVRFEKDFQSDIYERGNNILIHNKIQRPNIVWQEKVDSKLQN